MLASWPASKFAAIAVERRSRTGDPVFDGHDFPRGHLQHDIDRRGEPHTNVETLALQGAEALPREQERVLARRERGESIEPLVVGHGLGRTP